MPDSSCVLAIGGHAADMEFTAGAVVSFRMMRRDSSVTFGRHSEIISVIGWVNETTRLVRVFVGPGR